MIIILKEVGLNENFIVRFDERRAIWAQSNPEIDHEIIEFLAEESLAIGVGNKLTTVFWSAVNNYHFNNGQEYRALSDDLQKECQSSDAMLAFTMARCRSSYEGNHPSGADQAIRQALHKISDRVPLL